jgi:hypothetical protein
VAAMHESLPSMERNRYDVRISSTKCISKDVVSCRG